MKPTLTYVYLYKYMYMYVDCRRLAHRLRSRITLMWIRILIKISLQCGSGSTFSL
jgi:hypothetical protein